MKRFRGILAGVDLSLGDRFWAGLDFWIFHAVIVVGVIGLLLLTWLDATINKTAGTLATIAFGMALLLAFLLRGSPDPAVDERKDAA